MHLDMKKVPDKDEVQITIYAEPIKILSIEGDYVWCQWESRKWKMRVPNWVIPFDRQNDAFANAFLNYLNGLLTQPKASEEKENTKMTGKMQYLVSLPDETIEKVIELEKAWGIDRDTVIDQAINYFYQVDYVSRKKVEDQDAKT